ncbi:WecB/TagA/CpsF family glycosyltransferase [Bowmanella dokdonensis]
MQKVGLEWFYRFGQEPKRLFWRYIKHNPRFMLLGLRQLVLFWWQILCRKSRQS